MTVQTFTQINCVKYHSQWIVLNIYHRSFVQHYDIILMQHIISALYINHHEILTCPFGWYTSLSSSPKIDGNSLMHSWMFESIGTTKFNKHKIIICDVPSYAVTPSSFPTQGSVYCYLLISTNLERQTIFSLSFDRILDLYLYFNAAQYLKNLPLGASIHGKRTLDYQKLGWMTSMFGRQKY